MGIRRNFKPTNVCINGDFSNGLTNWAASKATHAVSGNVLVNTGDGTSTSGREQQDLGILTASVPSHKFYIRQTFRVTNAVCTQIQIGIYGSVSGTYSATTLNTPTENTWYTLSAIRTVTDQATNLGYRITHAYADAGTANGKVLEMKEVFLFDCTAQLPADLLALSDANLKAWCDLNIPNWFNGTLSGDRRIGGMR